MRLFNRRWKHLLRYTVLFCLLVGSLSFADYGYPYVGSFEVHRTTLFSNGYALNTVPEGMLLEKGGILYVDVERFLGLFGYRSRVYEDSQMLLLYQYNHRILFFANQKWVNEVGSFYAKGVEHENADSSGKIGEDRALSANTELWEGRYYVPLLDLQGLISFQYEDGNYGIIEVPVFTGLGGYRTSKEEVRDFARIIYYETRDSSMLKKTAVGGVIMNRVYSPLWPNTVHDVIFARNQFPPAYYESFSTLEPEAVQYEGAVRSLNGENNAPGCFFFNLAPFPGKEDDFYKIIEGDYFYY